MGDFDYTCAISGLPIGAGDKVRYLLISSSPYTSESCLMSSSWFPRTFPIKAEYNDYGSVENVEEGIGRDLWMEGLKLDMASCGIGDNTCHDVPTSKYMSFNDLLSAIIEGRVLVSRNYDRYNYASNLKRYRPKTPVGVPTMQRVRKILVKNKFKICTEFCGEGYIISKLRYGTICIRCSGYGKDAYGKEMYGRDIEFLLRLLPYLNQEYTTVIKAGDGSHRVELMVHVRPGTKDFHGSRKDKKTPLHVNHMMIREDVWQQLLQTPVEDNYGQSIATVEDHKQAIFDLYEKGYQIMVAYKNAETGSVEKDRLRFELNYGLDRDYNNLISPFVCKSEIPFTVGLGEHWKLLLEKCLPLEDVKHVLEAIAEFVHVWKVISKLRIAWHPSTSCGPQYGEWKSHQDFLHKLLVVVDQEVLTVT